jgi:hypothetical protein
MHIPKVADDLHPSLSGILRNDLLPLSIWSILLKGELPLHRGKGNSHFRAWMRGDHG